ncbi:MAG: hypothetical protein ABIH37_02995 [archaeon]
MRKRKVKAQVTIIIIVAIVIVGVILAIYAINIKTSPKFNSYDDTQINQINKQIYYCIEQRAIDVIYLLGLQGGYVNIPDDYVTTDLSDVAYGLKDNQNKLPTVLEVENEISGYIDFSSTYCLDKDFLEETYDIQTDFKDSETRVKIKDNSVEIEVYMPVVLTKGEATYEFDEKYNYEIPIRLGKIINIANQIIEKQKQSEDNIPLTYLSNIETKIIFDYIDSETIVYIIHDEESKVDETIYNFMFALEIG